MKEIILLRKIAEETKTLWDKGKIPLEDIYLKNLLVDYIDFKQRRNKMTERYGNRTLCSIFSNMRDLRKTHNYSYLPALIEEAQYRAERMENALEIYGNEWGGLNEMENKRKKLKKEIGILKKKKEELEDELPKKD